MIEKPQLKNKEEEMNKLLDERNELQNELSKLEGEIDEMEINLTDSENKTEQQLNNPKKIEFLKEQIFFLQSRINLKDQELLNLEKNN